jgi:hypothetical protein
MWPGRLRPLVAALGAGPVVACAVHTAPLGFLPTPQEAQSSAHGGWIELTLSGDQEERLVEGELLAVTADSVWVLGVAGGAGGVVVPTADVVRGRLTAYRWPSGQVTGWTVLGSFSTISNGLFLVFTAPAWIITGSLAGGAESRAAMRQVPPLEWATLAQFARFPQGISPGLSWESLQPKQE